MIGLDEVCAVIEKWTCPYFGAMAQRISDKIGQYVKDLKEKGAIKTGQVERAFSRVERHKLVERFYLPDEKGGPFEYAGARWRRRHFDAQEPDPELLKTIYSDCALLTRIDPPSSTSSPFLVAQMLELLELENGMNVLEIGAGTGYNAALMQEIVGSEGHITTIDIQEDVVEQTRRLLKGSRYGDIDVICTDGAQGFPENAPYDRIIATVGCPDISFRWAGQLRTDGFMLVPLQHGPEGLDPLVRLQRDGGKLIGEFAGGSGFMSIQGELAIERRIPFALQESLRSKEPKEDYPLPGVIEEMQEFGRKQQWDESFSFILFVAIVDDRCTRGGLYDQEKGAILVKGDKLLLHGEESLYWDLKSLCEQFEKLGKPAISDWQLEFLPRDAGVQVFEEEGTWVIERKFFREIIRLA